MENMENTNTAAEAATAAVEAETVVAATTTEDTTTEASVPEKGKKAKTPKKAKTTKKAKAPKEPKPPKEKKPKAPPKPKAPKASEMTLEELAETELVHAKITVSEDQKEEYAPLLGFIGQRFASKRELQEAGLEIAIYYFMQTEKSKGIIQRVEGQITMFDPTSQIIAIDGNKYKLNCTYTIEALNFDPFDEDAVFEPQSQDDEDEDEDEDDEEQDDYSDHEYDDEEHDDDEDDDRRYSRDRSSSYSRHEEYRYIEDEDGNTHRITLAQWREMERIQESMRRQMEYDMERMRRKSEERRAAQYSDSDGDGYYADDEYSGDDDYDDSGYVSDEKYPRKKSEDGQSSSSKKSTRSPKTIGWLPPEKRKLEIHDKKKKPKSSKKDSGNSDD